MASSAGGNEVAFAFQCSLCGTYTLVCVGALDPGEVERRASSRSCGGGSGHGSKMLQKDVHVAQQTLLERMQYRLVPASGEETEASNENALEEPGSRYVLLPCATCFEICNDTSYIGFIEDRDNLECDIPFCPHVAVTFEANELPPAYVFRSGKWCLAQGVGPQDLEVKLPCHLPAQQFRTLLPPTSLALRPPCRQRQQTSGKYVRGLRSSRQQRAVAAQEPPIGVVLPWLSGFLDRASEAVLAEPRTKRPSAPRKGRSSAAASQADGARDGARYVRAPLLSAVKPIGELVAALSEALLVQSEET